MVKTRQDIQDIEKWFSVSLKGVENEAFPVKNVALEIFIFILCQIRHFLRSFLLMTGLCVFNVTVQWYTVTFSFLTILYA